MLFKRPTLDEIAAGRVRQAFRRWKRPTVRAGGTLRTEIGVLAIDRIEPVTLDSLTPADARLAGYESLVKLLEEVSQPREGTLYRIDFRLAGPDPRIALRGQASLTPEEAEEIQSALLGWTRSAAGPWTRAVLQAIGEHPGLPAGELATTLDTPKERLKIDVRKLKEFGLTESLQPGYRLSPRGKTFLRLGAPRNPRDPGGSPCKKR